MVRCLNYVLFPPSLQVLIHQSEYATISLFAASAFVFALMAAILPIETAGKPLKVQTSVYMFSKILSKS